MNPDLDLLVNRIEQMAEALESTEEHLCRIALLGLTRHWHAADRWATLELAPSPSAPLWLREQERDKLLAAIRGQKGAEIRQLRQALQELY